MTIKQQLARIVNSLTGSDSTAKNIPGTLGEIADAVENGGGSGSGSNSPLIIEVASTGTFEGGDLSVTVETTPAELDAAFNAGKNIYLKFANSEGMTRMTPLFTYEKRPVEAGSDVMIYAAQFYAKEENIADESWVILDNGDTAEHATLGVFYKIGDTTIYDYREHLGNS